MIEQPNEGSFLGKIIAIVVLAIDQLNAQILVL